MEDKKIVDLFFKRDEKAIIESKLKYNNYLFKIASNILRDNRDREECVDDTYIKAWNNIPPQKPQNLKLYFAKILRNLCIDLYRKYNAAKRGSNQIDTSLDEIGEIIGKTNVEEIVQLRELTDSIQKFLDGLNEKDKNIFLMRYFYIDSLKDIAKYMGMNENSVKQNLFRTRNKLKIYLIDEGYSL